MLSGGSFAILLYAGEIAPCHNSLRNKSGCRRTVHGNRSCIGLVDGPPVGRQVGWYLGGLRLLESLQHFVPSNTTGVRTLRHHSVHSGGSGNSSRRTVVPV